VNYPIEGDLIFAGGKAYRARQRAWQHGGKLVLFVDRYEYWGNYASENEVMSRSFLQG
jgi:hypothetical protein